MSFLPGSWRAWINRSAAGPFLNADSLNDWELKFRALDCLGAVRALGLVDALPGSPVDGDAYLTSATATPANKLVRRFGSTWESFTPPNGMVAWLPDGSAKQFLSGAWGDADFGGGGAVSSVFGRTGAVAAQTGDYTAAQVGAEPYAGTPAQTSFWRSTAAGVRAWVQLVAADITDLATTLAAYLTKANPTFTGVLTGPRANLTEFGVLRDRVGNPSFGGLYAAGVTPAATNYALAMTDSGTEVYLGASDKVVLVVGGTSKLTVDADEANLASGVALKMAATTVIDVSCNGSLKSLTVDENIFLPKSVVWKSGATNYFSMYATSFEFGIRDLNDDGSVIAYPLIVKRGVGGEVQIGYSGGLRPVRIGGALKNENLAGSGTRPVVALADGTVDDQDAAAFRGTIGALASSLKGAANGVAELGADGKVPSAQLPASTLPTDPVFDTVTTTGAAYIGTNLDVSGNAVVDGWASIAGSLQAADARFTNLSHALGGTATQLPGASESGNLVASGLSTTAGTTGKFLVRKYRTLIGPLGAADYSVSTGGGLFVSSETLTEPILALGHGSEVIALIADVRFAQVVAAGKTGAMPAMKAQIQVQTIGSGGSVGGYGARVTHRVRGDNANDLTDVLELESSQVAVKIPLRTDSACHNKVAIRTDTTTTAANNHVVIFDGLGDRTETLPAATGSNRVLVMKNRSSAYSWTLDGNGSETIDGAATLVLTANQCATLIDYASGQWAVIGKVG